MSTATTRRAAEQEGEALEREALERDALERKQLLYRDRMHFNTMRVLNTPNDKYERPSWLKEGDDESAKANHDRHAAAQIIGLVDHLHDTRGRLKYLRSMNQLKATEKRELDVLSRRVGAIRRLIGERSDPDKVATSKGDLYSDHESDADYSDNEEERPRSIDLSSSRSRRFGGSARLSNFAAPTHLLRHNEDLIAPAESV